MFQSRFLKDFLFLDASGVREGVQPRARAERSWGQQVPRLCLRWHLGDCKDPHARHGAPQTQGEARHASQLHGGWPRGGQNGSGCDEWNQLLWSDGKFVLPDDLQLVFGPNTVSDQPVYNSVSLQKASGDFQDFIIVWAVKWRFLKLKSCKGHIVISKWKEGYTFIPANCFQEAEGGQTFQNASWDWRLVMLNIQCSWQNKS